MDREVQGRLTLASIVGVGLICTGIYCCRKYDQLGHPTPDQKIYHSVAQGSIVLGAGASLIVALRAYNARNT